MYDDTDDVMVMALGDPDYPQGSRAECVVCTGAVYRDVLLPMELRHVDPVEFPHTPQIEGVVVPKVTVVIQPDGRVNVYRTSRIHVEKITKPRPGDDATGEFDWSAEPQGVMCEVSLPIDLSDVTDPHEAALRYLTVVRNANTEGIPLYVNVSPADGTHTTVCVQPDGDARQIATFQRTPPEPENTDENGRRA